MSLISIIVPCYNEKNALSLFVEEVRRIGVTLVEDDIELVFVDDGSTDGTLGEMRRLCAERAGMRFISFSRNFGKEAAMLAGLKASTGEYVAVMDADLQDPPSLLPEMLKALKEEGYDCVGTRRVTRKGELWWPQKLGR